MRFAIYLVDCAVEKSKKNWQNKPQGSRNWSCAASRSPSGLLPPDFYVGQGQGATPIDSEVGLELD